MECPRCRETMSPITVGDYKICECIFCGGNWLDKSALDSLLSELLHSGANIHDVYSDIGENSNHPNSSCPSCKSISLCGCSFRGVSVDICPRCKGAFFEKGRLEESLPIVHKLKKEKLDKIANKIARPAMYIIIILVIAAAAPLFSVTKYTRGIQKGCSNNFKYMTRERLSRYYGVERKPDEVNKIGNQKIEVIYYRQRPGEKASRHWSGYTINFFIFPILPLKFPDGYLQESFILENGLIVDCTNYWNKIEGGPNYHF